MALFTLGLAACGGEQASQPTSPVAVPVLPPAPTPQPTPTSPAQPAPTTTGGTATLTWTAPTQNTDGSSLNDLYGYWVYHGTEPGEWKEQVQVVGARSTTYTFKELPAGTHYFAVAAMNSAGTESPLSAVGSKTIQ